MTRECFVHPPGVDSIRIDHSPHATVGRLHGVSDDEHPGSRYRLRPLNDLAHRSRPDAGAYDIAQTAGLLRRLLLDGGRLVDIVNWDIKAQIRLEWTPQRVLGVSRLWIASNVLDPAAAESHVYVQVPDDPDRYVLQEHVPPTIVNKYVRLLEHDAIFHNGAQRG